MCAFKNPHQMKICREKKNHQIAHNLNWRITNYFACCWWLIYHWFLWNCVHNQVNIINRNISIDVTKAKQRSSKRFYLIKNEAFNSRRRSWSDHKAKRNLKFSFTTGIQIENWGAWIEVNSCVCVSGRMVFKSNETSLHVCALHWIMPRNQETMHH